MEFVNALIWNLMCNISTTFEIWKCKKICTLFSFFKRTAIYLNTTVHSMSNLSGRPVCINSLVNANISSANHVAATKCIKACICGQEVQLLQTKH